MLIKFRVIPSIEKLDTIINESKGNVYMEISDKIFLDLKRESNLYDLLNQNISENNAIRLHVFDKDDYFRLVNYMI